MSDSNKTWFEKADAVIVKVIKGISQISGVCLILIMLVAFINVLGEKIFHNGIPGSTEMITYLHVPVVFLAAAYVTLDAGHTRIDLLVSHLKPGIQKILGVIGCIIATIVCTFVGIRGFYRMGDLVAHHSKSSVTGFGFAIWPFALIFGIGFFALAFTFLWSVIRVFHQPADMAKTEGPSEMAEELEEQADKFLEEEEKRSEEGTETAQAVSEEPDEDKKSDDTEGGADQ